MPSEKDTPQPALMWFRDDLRLHDNAALVWAAKQGPVIAVVIDEDATATGARALGAAARWWWQRSVHQLNKRLAAHGVPLLYYQGDPRAIIPAVVQKFGVSAVGWSRRYHKPLRELDAQLKHLLQEKGVAAKSFPGHLLTEPWEVQTQQGKQYKVYTPFAKTARGVAADNVASYLNNDNDQAPSPTSHDELGPIGLAGPRADLASAHPLPDWDEADWTHSLAQHWSPGENSAWKVAEEFLSELAAASKQQAPHYAADRDRLDKQATSRLSPYLRFGEISIHRLWAMVTEANDTGRIAGEDASAFLSELLWRDFAWHRLYHLPDLHRRNVREQFDHFDWHWDENEARRIASTRRDPRWPETEKDIPEIATADDFHSVFSAWRAGKTGVAVVDAGMRELWATGTMHNRVRMVVASFLTKNLGIHWRHGEAWFWDTLVDADPASNPFNWQWAAGCGDDAAPYFRIFNPDTQAKRFDPDYRYIQHWVPEYATPIYPQPVVDLKASRRQALAAYEEMKNFHPRPE